MDNNELKLKFEKVQKELDASKAENKDVSALLKEKYELLKIGYEKIKNETASSEFDKNPKKYSTLLSYINTMKETAKEGGMPSDEVIVFENEVKEEMKKNNLDWLLNK